MEWLLKAKPDRLYQNNCLVKGNRDKQLAAPKTNHMLIRGLKPNRPNPTPPFPSLNHTKETQEKDLELSLGRIYQPKEDRLLHFGLSELPASLNQLEASCESETEESLPEDFLSLAPLGSSTMARNNSDKEKTPAVDVDDVQIRALIRRDEGKRVRQNSQMDSSMEGEDVHPLPRPSSPSRVPVWAVESVSTNPALKRALGKIQLELRALGVGPTKYQDPWRPVVITDRALPYAPVIMPVFSSEPTIAGPAVTPLPLPLPAVSGSVASNKRPKIPKEEEGSGESDEYHELRDMNTIKSMPSVAATGDGPEGKTVAGFMYKSNTSGGLRIVCACHGSFLTPEDFVKHAGCTGMRNPMKHIRVCKNPYLFIND